MSEVYSKRLLSEELRDSSVEADNKRQEDNNKKVNKPGRKPLATEPKNKRTAQNRAAQRAFRERKERKMKELEDKITNLENEKKSAHTESEFLRLQVQMLMNELAKHRGTHDVSDLDLPKVPSPVGNQLQKEHLSSAESNAPSSIFSDHGSTRTNSSTLDDFNTKPPQQPFSFEFPWSRKNSTTSARSNQSIGGGVVGGGVQSANSTTAPGLASDSSTTSSAESSPFELYNTDDQRDLPLFNKVKQQTKDQESFKFNEHFDEGISDFCKDLNKACGTKDCPDPRKIKKDSNTSTPNSNATDTPHTYNDTSVNEDPLSFLNDGYGENFNTFDPTLAFASENNFDDLFNEGNNFTQQNDPLSSLTTEESIYDPFGIFNQAKSPIVEKHTPAVVQKENISTKENKTPSSNVPTINQELGIEVYNDVDVVPSRDGKMLKCTEIWDRITAHPKYSEIDIDGLCSELRSKAKCSDKGVVIDFADVNNVITANIPK